MQINGRPVLGGAETLKSLIGSVAAKGLAIALCIGLAACAEDRNYPSLTQISGLGSVMTPLERQKAVEELQKQDQAHSNSSLKSADQ
jgi:hypothetical protein